MPGEPDAYLMLREGLFFNDVTASNLVKLGLDRTIRTEGVTVTPPGSPFTKRSWPETRMCTP